MEIEVKIEKKKEREKWKNEKEREKSNFTVFPPGTNTPSAETLVC